MQNASACKRIVQMRVLTTGCVRTGIQCVREYHHSYSFSTRSTAFSTESPLFTSSFYASNPCTVLNRINAAFHRRSLMALYSRQFSGYNRPRLGERKEQNQMIEKKVYNGSDAKEEVYDENEDEDEDEDEHQLNTSVIIESKDLVWSNETLDQILPDIEDKLRPTLAQALPLLTFTPESTRKAISNLHELLPTLTTRQISLIVQQVPYLLAYNKSKIKRRAGALYFHMPSLSPRHVQSIISRCPQLLLYNPTVALRERFVQLQQLLPRVDLGKLIYWKPELLLHSGLAYKNRLNAWATHTDLNIQEICAMVQRNPIVLLRRPNTVAAAKVVETDEFKAMWDAKSLPQPLLKFAHYFTHVFNALASDIDTGVLEGIKKYEKPTLLMLESDKLPTLNERVEEEYATFVDPFDYSIEPKKNGFLLGILVLMPKPAYEASFPYFIVPEFSADIPFREVFAVESLKTSRKGQRKRLKMLAEMTTKHLVGSQQVDTESADRVGESSQDPADLDGSKQDIEVDKFHDIVSPRARTHGPNKAGHAQLLKHRAHPTGSVEVDDAAQSHDVTQTRNNKPERTAKFGSNDKSDVLFKSARPTAEPSFPRYREFTSRKWEKNAEREDHRETPKRYHSDRRNDNADTPRGDSSDRRPPEFNVLRERKPDPSQRFKGEDKSNSRVEQRMDRNLERGGRLPYTDRNVHRNDHARINNRRDGGESRNNYRKRDGDRNRDRGESRPRTYSRDAGDRNRDRTYSREAGESNGFRSRERRNRDGDETRGDQNQHRGRTGSRTRTDSNQNGEGNRFRSSERREYRSQDGDGTRDQNRDRNGNRPRPRTSSHENGEANGFRSRDRRENRSNDDERRRNSQANFSRGRERTESSFKDNKSRENRQNRQNNFSPRRAPQYSNSNSRTTRS